MLVAMEMMARLEQFDIGPAVRLIGVDTRGDRLVLRLPEAVGVGEAAILAEQVGDDPALILVEREQRRLGRDIGTEQPCL